MPFFIDPTWTPKNSTKGAKIASYIPELNALQHSGLRFWVSHIVWGIDCSGLRNEKASFYKMSVFVFVSWQRQDDGTLTRGTLIPTFLGACNYIKADL